MTEDCDCCPDEEQTAEQTMNETGESPDETPAEACPCPSGISGKYVEPCVLLCLLEEKAHGYELIQSIQKLGASVDASGVYRTLRSMEEDELVESTWDEGEAGPQKRIYEITRDGRDMLQGWVVQIRQDRDSFEQFLDEYQSNKDS